MTAVATPIQLSDPSGPGWTDTNGYSSSMNGTVMTQGDSTSIISPLSSNRKSPPRANSSASLLSNASAESDVSDSASIRTVVGPGCSEPVEDWAVRKRPTRGIWPSGKSEATAVLSTARSQSSISTATSGPSAASAISALHTPIMSPQQVPSPQSQMSNGIRVGVHPSDPSVVLFLLPINDTFERKTISVPLTPSVVRVGRQTNIKTAPTPTNAFFDSKVLSRQHAEVFADRQGRVFIKDVKSSNGTFVNGMRLSPENQESEPHELHEQDIVELGIDIVSEDQKVVVHHKVAARVEHAGIYVQSREHPFAENDAALAGRKGYSQQMKRGGPAGSGTLKTGINNANTAAALAARDDMNQQQQAQQQQQQQQQQAQQQHQQQQQQHQMLSRMILQPVSTEQIVRRLNHELRLARQQSKDIAKIRHNLHARPVNDSITAELEHPGDFSQPVQPQHVSKLDNTARSTLPSTELTLQTAFDGPIQPESQLPLRGQPVLSRSDTLKPAEMVSPTTAISQSHEALTTLSRELDAANARIPSLEDRIKLLERELSVERDARAKAEAQSKSTNTSTDTSTINEFKERHGSSKPEAPGVKTTKDLQNELERMKSIINDMKTTVEVYSQRAETAEQERDETRKTLAEMVEENRANLRHTDRKDRMTVSANIGTGGGKLRTRTNTNDDRDNKAKNILLPDILSEAGIGQDPKLSPQQAAALQSILHRNSIRTESGSWLHLSHHGVPHMCAVTTIVLGLTLMHYLNGWEKVQR